MWLPLGVLTGVGLIGAGVIALQDELVRRATTAATMWFSTIAGLCLGDGQLIPGGVSSLIGILVLWGLRPIEKSLERFQLRRLSLMIAEGHRLPQERRAQLEVASMHVMSFSFSHAAVEGKIFFDASFGGRD